MAVLDSLGGVCCALERVGVLPWESTTLRSWTLSWEQGRQDPWWVGHTGGFPLVHGMGVGAQVEGGEQHLGSLGQGTSDSFCWIRAPSPLTLWEGKPLLPATSLPLHAWTSCSRRGSCPPQGGIRALPCSPKAVVTLHCGPGPIRLCCLWACQCGSGPGPSSEALNTVYAAAPAPGGHCAGSDPSARGSYQLPTAVCTRPPALPALQTRR